MPRGTKQTAIKKIQIFLQSLKDGAEPTNLSSFCHDRYLNHSVGLMCVQLGLLEKRNGVYKWVKGNGKVTETLAQQVQELASAYTNAIVK